MANGSEPQEVHGVYWREDRQAWAARYKINGKLVRKVFGPADSDWQHAVDWLEDARSLKRKEGAGALPVSATEPILTMAEKRVLREEQADRVTLAELCDDLKAYIKKHPSQYKDQVNPPQRLDRIKTEIGDRPAAGIRPKDIEEWLDGLKNLHPQRGQGKPVADATYNRYRVTLSSVYKRGIKNEKVAENPVKGTSQRKLDNNVIRWLKPHEEKAIRAVITERIRSATQAGQPLNADHERHHMCELIVSIQTGMRASEQSRLEWPDIDLKRRQIHVRKSKNTLERYIPMLPEVMTAFKTLKSMDLKRKDRAIDQPNKSPEDVCFGLENYKTWWTAVRKEAKVKNYRWHDNRHTFCSRLAQAGKSLKVVQELAGHKDIKTTARYAHLDGGSKLEAMEDAFGVAKRKPKNSR